MANKPEALRLANLIEGSVSDLHREAAATELRRLHAENEQITTYADALNERCIKDAKRIGALLDALRRVMRHIPADAGGASLSDDMRRARSAIAQAED